MKVIFLDIDGVLQSGRTFIATGRFALASSKENLLEVFDRIAVSLLINFLDATDVKLVLHSTWRLRKDSRDTLANIGLNFFGFTKGGISKAKSIKEWVVENNPEKWCVLDDTDLEVENLVLVDRMNGLLLSHLFEAERLLEVDWKLPRLFL